MKLNTYPAGSLTIKTELPAVADLESLNDQAIRAVDALTEQMKTVDNVGKVFLLKTSSGNYTKDTYYKLVVDKVDPLKPTFKFVEFGTGEVDTLENLMKMVENYPIYKESLPEPGAGILVQYMFSDKATDGTVCNTKALVEANSANLNTISTPWTILGYNKTIPQYVKYRLRNADGTYAYRYVSSVDDTTLDATVDGTPATVIVKHGFENAQLIDSNDQTGLLRTILAGAKTYTRDNSTIGFGETSKFEVTSDAVTAVSEEIAEGITGNDGAPHTYGNLNPYDCPKTVTIGGQVYEFCGYTVTLQSTNLLTGNNGSSYQETCRFDAPENQFAEAFNRFETGKEYYKRSGITFTKMTVTDGDPIVQAEVYVKDGDTFTCKSSYVQENHTYSSAVTAGTLITDTSLSIQNNTYYEYGCNKWSQSDARAYINSEVGSAEFKAGKATEKKNPFEKNSATATQTTGMSTCNGLMLKLAKDAELLKYLCPAVNRTSVFDKQYNTYNTDSRWKGSFVAYKNLETTTINTSGKKVYRTHNADKLFLLTYDELGYTTENGSFDKNEATSTFFEVYPKNTSWDTSSPKIGNMDACRKKYAYRSSGALNSASAIWWTRSAYGHYPHRVALVDSSGAYCTLANYSITP